MLILFPTFVAYGQYSPMERKLYYLSTCSTCTRIIKEIQPDKTFELQDIKTDPITSDQLNQMRDLAGSYELLFSSKALKYRYLGLNKKRLAEEDYRKLILEEYTFLKRPVFLIDGDIYIGNSKTTTELVKRRLSK